MKDCNGELKAWTHHFCDTCVSVEPSNKFNMSQRQGDFFRQPHCTDCFATQRRGSAQRRTQLVCSNCQKHFDFDPNGHITNDMRKNHFRKSRENFNSVICYTCYEKRPRYICGRCKHTGPREDFQRENFPRACKRGTQMCLECKSGRRKGKRCLVDKCKTFVRKENLSKTHKNQLGRAFVCDTCTENGYTTKNPKTYTCSACKKVTGGHGLFQSKNFPRAAKTGTQKCKGCFQ